jgi:2-methylisocitrate lyase-like PEP mutase family enzyme
MLKDIGRARELILAEDILILPAVYDGFSARVVEEAGFEAALITGAGLSESRAGRPDVGLMGLEENLDACRMLAECTDLLLFADGDTGYGNAVNVFYNVRKFEATGVAGVMIEDQVSPKRCGHLAGKEVIPAEEMVYKIRAAVDARRNPAFIIKARTDSAGTLGIGEAIRRANLYAEAGADLLFADALLSREMIGTFASEVSAPVCINMGFGLRARETTPLMSPVELRELGVAVVEYPRMLSAAAVRAQKNVLRLFQESIASRDVAERPDLLASFDEMSELMALPEILDLEERYLTRDQYARMYVDNAHNETALAFKENRSSHEHRRVRETGA